MFLKQADLFLGIGHQFLQKAMMLSQKEAYDEGAYLFHEGDPAAHFYILIDGAVQLQIKDNQHVVHIGRQVGETFGWSALLGDRRYTASALCIQSSYLLKFETAAFAELLTKHPDSQTIFFRQLAAALGNRLLQCYRILSQTPTGSDPV